MSARNGADGDHKTNLPAWAGSLEFFVDSDGPRPALLSPQGNESVSSPFDDWHPQLAARTTTSAPILLAAPG